MGHSQSTTQRSQGRTSPVTEQQQQLHNDESAVSNMDHTPPLPPETNTSEDTMTINSTHQVQDSDLELLTGLLAEYFNSENTTPIECTDSCIPINKILASCARVLSKFPTSEDKVLLVIENVLPMCSQLLPEEATSQVIELQMNALEAFSQQEISSSSMIVGPAMNFLALLWRKYSSSLTASCNIRQLALVLNAALQSEQKEDAVKYGDLFVISLVMSLSDGQLDALDKEGVYKSLRSLLHHYDSTDSATLRHIVAGVGLFANLRPAAQQFLEENLYFDLVLAAQKYATDAALQEMIWQLLTLLCIRDKNFAVTIADMEVIPAVLVVIKQEGAPLMPILKFITSCCQQDSSYYAQCLGDCGLLEHMLGIIKSPTSSLKDKNNLSDFLALICSKAPKQFLPRLLELKLVAELEEVCQTQPEVGVVPTYLAIDGMISLLSQHQAAGAPDIASMIDSFYAMDHHLFLQHTLAAPIVYSNQSLLEMIYLAQQKLLKLITPQAMRKMCNKEFVELYSISFVRDTITFQSLASRVVFATHHFVFQIRETECIELLRDTNFHTPVVELINSSSYEVMCTGLGLLSCLISKYFEYLKDVKPFLDAGVPALILEQARQYGNRKELHFGDEMSRILLNLTSEKELSLRLYKEGFLEQLLDNLDDSYSPTVKRCIVHAAGNIALAGQNAKEALFERNFHLRLLNMLSTEAEKGDASQLSACCRVLHILAAGDAAKRQFVKSECIPLLLKILRTRKDITEVRLRSLGLLSTLGFMAILNRHFILTREVIDTVVRILKEDQHGKVLGYTMLVFLANLQLDSGAVQMRQLAIEDKVREVYQNSGYQKQSPELERWGKHVLENQDLYTVTTPPRTTHPHCSPEDCRLSDWPFQYNCDGMRLLPLDEKYFEPKTPTAVELTTIAKDQLRQLGINPDLPIFRIGRVYGSTYGWCSNCDREGASYELVIRVQSMTPMQYQHLIDNGWYRRGGVKMFRMMHNHATVCCDWETRVNVSKFDFQSHKSYKKVLRRMPTDRLTIETEPRHFSTEAFDLYNSYHILRHEKPQKSEFSYVEHVVNSPIAHQTIDGVEYGTFHQKYRLDGKLVAVGIVDIVPKGMVSIYMWYDVSKEVSKLSFGVFSALKEIEMVQNRNKTDPSVKHYYLQGWNPNNHKLSYKANYEPEEFYCPAITTDWVCSKEEVTTEIERIKKEKMASKQEDMETSAATTNSKPSEETDSAAPKQSSKGEEADRNKKKEDTLKDKELNAIACDAVDMDRLKHQQRTDSTSIDVSKIIVCLNYSQYMYLGQLFEQFSIGAHQKEMMEKRYEELYLALCPELTNQLVIDLKACLKDDKVQVMDNMGGALDIPIREEQSDRRSLVN